MMNKEFKDWLEDKKRYSIRPYLNGGKLIIPNLDIQKELDIVIEKYVELHKLPVIPKYVAEWIEEEHGTMSNWKLPSAFISDSKYKKDQRRYKWSQIEGNMDKFMSALINGYEIEQEPLYYALVKGHELVEDDFKYWWLDFDSTLMIEDKGARLTKSGWNELGVDESIAEFKEELVDDE